MQKRLNGLAHECGLLADEIARLETGHFREVDKDAKGTPVDITDIWINHLKAMLFQKELLMNELNLRYQLGGPAPQS